MNIRAAVMRAPGRPLEVCDLELAPPERDEVRVRILASGVCRSDLSYIDGKWPTPLPIVLGHEGAGTIEAVGDGVDRQRVGERVVLTFAPACGRCRQCLAGRANLCQDAAQGLDIRAHYDMRAQRSFVRGHRIADRRPHTNRRSCQWSDECRDDSDVDVIDRIEVHLAYRAGAVGVSLSHLAKGGRIDIDF